MVPFDASNEVHGGVGRWTQVSPQRIIRPPVILTHEAKRSEKETHPDG